MECEKIIDAEIAGQTIFGMHNRVCGCPNFDATFAFCVTNIPPFAEEKMSRIFLNVISQQIVSEVNHQTLAYRIHLNAYITWSVPT